MRDEAVTVTAAEFHRNLDVYEDMALTRPVTITEDGEERRVLISAEEFHRLRRQDRRVLSAEEFSDEQIEGIRNAEVPAKYAYLNEELKDWKA